MKQSQEMTVKETLLRLKKKSFSSVDDSETSVLGSIQEFCAMLPPTSCEGNIIRFNFWVTHLFSFSSWFVTHSLVTVLLDPP